MPDPEQSLLWILSAGVVVVGSATAAVLWWRKYRLISLLTLGGAGLMALPGAMLCARWMSYWMSRPGPEEIRRELPGDWRGLNPWAGEHIRISPDLGFVQRLESGDSTRRLEAGTVSLAANGLIGFSSLSVPTDAALANPSGPPDRVTVGDFVPFRFARGESAPLLILQHGGADQPYVLRRVSREPSR